MPDSCARGFGPPWDWNIKVLKQWFVTLKTRLPQREEKPRNMATMWDNKSKYLLQDTENKYGSQTTSRWKAPSNIRQYHQCSVGTFHWIILGWKKKCKRWILVVDESLMLTKINKLVADCLLTGETCKSNRRAKFVRWEQWHTVWVWLLENM